MSADNEQSKDGVHPKANQDPELDVGSDKFNPLRALYATDFKVTHKSPKVFYQNLSAFESALKKFGVWQLNKPQKVNPFAGPSNNAATASETQKPERRFEPHQMAIPTNTKTKHQRNIYTHMEGTEGPLAALHKCISSIPTSQRVRVVMRKESSVGGTIEGELVAFDKQWNLLLKHAVEVWKRRKYKYGEQKICAGAPEDCSERLHKLGIVIPSFQIKSLNRKNVQLRREIPQLLVRGENIVLISFLGNK